MNFLVIFAKMSYSSLELIAKVEIFSTKTKLVHFDAYRLENTLEYCALVRNRAFFFCGKKFFIPDSPTSYCQIIPIHPVSYYRTYTNGVQ